MKPGSSFRHKAAALRVVPALLGLAVLAIVVCVLLLWADPIAPLLLIAGAVGAAVTLVLLQAPQTAFHVALFLTLLPHGLRPPPFEVLYTIAVNAAVMLALASWILQSGMRLQSMVLGRTGLALACFIAWALVTSSWAESLVDARRTLVAFAINFTVFMLISNQVRDVRAIDGLMTVLRILGWIMVAAGVYAFVDGGLRFGSRLKIFGMNENDYGLTLIAMIPGVIWPVLRQSGPRRKLGMALSAVFTICAMVLIALTGSRGSSLSLLLVLLAFAFSKPMRPWGVVGLVMLSGLLVSAPFLLGSVINRFAEQDGGQLGGRDLLWTAGLRMLADVPWTGAGIGNGPLHLHNYIAALTSEFNHRSDLPTHNPFIEIGIETGVLGLCLYVNVCVSALRQFFGAEGRAGMRRPELSGYFPLMIGIATGYASSWIKGGGVEIHPTFFVLLALLTVPSQLAWTGQVRGGDAREPSPSAPGRASLGWVEV